MTVQQWVFECLRGKGGAGKGCLRSNVVPQLDEGLHLVEGRPVLDAASKVPEHDGCVVLEVGDADRAQPASIVILHRQGGHVSPRQNHESLALGVSSLEDLNMGKAHLEGLRQICTSHAMCQRPVSRNLNQRLAHMGQSLSRQSGRNQSTSDMEALTVLLQLEQ